MISAGSDKLAAKRAYECAEEMLSSGVGSMDVQDRLEKDFQLEEGLAKTIILASPEFNSQFAYASWSERKEVGVSERPARAFLKRKFDLTEAELDWLHNEYEKGNTMAFRKLRDLKQLAEVTLVPDAYLELQQMGLIS